MAGVFSTNDLLLAIAVELVALNQLIAEEAGLDTELEEFRKDARDKFAVPHEPALSAED